MSAVQSFKLQTIRYADSRDVTVQKVAVSVPLSGTAAVTLHPVEVGNKNNPSTALLSRHDSRVKHWHYSLLLTTLLSTYNRFREPQGSALTPDYEKRR